MATCKCSVHFACQPYATDRKANHDVGRFALERPGGATAISRRLSIAIPPVLVATERTTNPVGFAAKARCDPSTVLYLTTIRRYRRRRSSTFGRGPRANGFH